MIEQAAKKKRKLLGFYVAAFALLGLLVAGAFLYEPLKLRYAIYRLRKAGRWSRADTKWRDECLKGACRGDKRAVDALVESWKYASSGPVVDDALYRTAAAAPEHFYDALNAQADEPVLYMLLAVARGCWAHTSDRNDHTTRGLVLMEIRRGDMSPRNMATMLDAVSLPAKGEPRRVAREALAFIRRRFAKELAEPEKKAVEEEKGTPK